jgi:predicted MFS family arabinose efflux permease
VVPPTGSRKLWLLLAAKGTSDVGFALDYVCLTVFVWQRTRSALATGLVGLCLYGGGIVGGRLGHRFGGRWDRRRVMIAADLSRAAALALLAGLPGGAQLRWLFPTVVIIGAGRSMFEANLGAATPVLAGSAAQTVNSLISGLRGAALVAGMGLAAVAVPAVGYRGVFAFDAATYLLSAGTLTALRLRMQELAPGPPAQRAAGHAARLGWAYLVAAGLALPLAVRGLDALGSASQNIGLPVLGSQRDPGDPTAVTGLIWMTWAAGTIVGSLALRPLLRGVIGRAPGQVFFVATAAMSVGFVGIFWLGNWPLILAAAVLAGLGDSLSEITYKQALQQLPDGQRSQVFGFSQMVVNAGFVAGLIAFGATLVPVQVRYWVLVAHAVPFLAAIVCALLPSSATRARTAKAAEAMLMRSER